MAVFFTCIILVGSGITMVSLILMLAEKKRMHDYRKDLRDGKENLIEVIEDAEALVSEMNKFSDYAVARIEEKNAELENLISQADLRIELLNQSSEKAPDLQEPQYNEDKILKILGEDKREQDDGDVRVRKGKVLTFDLKRREIIKLSKSGLDSTEIARLLNCGKGEIELISRMGR